MQRQQQIGNESVLQNLCDPHEHWPFGVNADGGNSQGRIQSGLVLGSFGRRSVDVHL